MRVFKFFFFLLAISLVFFSCEDACKDVDCVNGECNSGVCDCYVGFEKNELGVCDCGGQTYLGPNGDCIELAACGNGYCDANQFCDPDFGCSCSPGYYDYYDNYTGAYTCKQSSLILLGNHYVYQDCSFNDQNLELNIVQGETPIDMLMTGFWDEIGEPITITFYDNYKFSGVETFTVGGFTYEVTIDGGIDSYNEIFYQIAVRKKSLSTNAIIYDLDCEVN